MMLDNLDNFKPFFYRNRRNAAKKMRVLQGILMIILLFGLSRPLKAQYKYIFVTSFPSQIALLDSICIVMAKADSTTFYNEIKKLRNSAVTTSVYTQLNLERAILSVKTDKGYELETAVSNGEKLIEEAMQLDAPEIAAVQYMTLGYYYELKKQNFGKAFEHYLKAYNLFEKIPIEKLPPTQYELYVVSQLYYHYSDFENALRLSLRTEKSFTKKTFVYIFNTDLIGMCYLKTAKYDSARMYFQLVLANAHLMESEAGWKGIALGNTGLCYFLQNDFKKATEYLLQAVTLTMQGKVYDNTVPFATHLSEIYLKENNLAGAKKFIDTALQTAHIASDNQNYFRAYTASAEYYRASGNLPLSVVYGDSAALFSRKLDEQKDLNTKYKVEMAVQYNQDRERERSFAKEKERQLLLRNGIIAFVVLLMIISLLLYNSNRLKYRNRQQQLIAEKKLAENELRSATEQLNAFTQSIRQKNELIEQASLEIDRINDELKLVNNERLGLGALPESHNQSLQLLQNAVLLTDENWRNFTQLFEKVHSGFFQRLKQKIPGLSPAETRFAALTKLQLSNKEMANMLGVGTEAIRQIRSRLKKKLNPEADEGIEQLVERI